MSRFTDIVHAIGDDTIVVTGANGSVGRLLRANLPASLNLRLVARHPDGPIHPREQWVTGDLSEAGFAREVLGGAKHLVHLAGIPTPVATREELTHANVEMLGTVLSAAVETGVTRIVTASSVHVMGLYNRPATRPVQGSWEPAPCCIYGESKVAGEAVVRAVAAGSGATMVNLRLGGVASEPPDRDIFETWLGGEDLAAITLLSFFPPEQSPAYFAVSGDAASRWDITPAQRDLGYRPVSSLPYGYFDLTAPVIDNTHCRFRVAPAFVEPS